MKCMVYEKHTGASVSFSDLGGVIKELHEHEHFVAEDGMKFQQLTKTMMVIMVQAVFTDISFPYAQGISSCCRPVSSNLESSWPSRV